MIRAARFVPHRGATAVVAVLVPVCVALWTATLAQGPAEFTLFLPLGVSLVVVGSFLGVRMTRNPIGWLVLAWGVVVSYCVFVSVWGARALRDHLPVGPAQRWLSVVMPVVWHPGFILFMLAMFVFPAGRFLSRRWRRTAWAAVAFATTLAVLSALSPVGALADYIPGVPPPYTSPIEHGAHAVFDALLSFLIVWLAVGITSMLIRWRRATGDDRRQVTAFVLPTSVSLALFAVSVFVIGDGRLGFVLLAVLPISLAVAVTRFHLYEIDMIVSRTVSYGVVTAVVVGVYVGAVELVGLLLPPAGSVAVAAATLAAAAAFTPVRRRVQRFVGRRFDRTRYDRDQLVERFRAELRRDAELPEVEDRLLGAVDVALRPVAATVWLRPRDATT